MSCRQDILCICEWKSRILATADNSGLILIWDLPGGDLKATLSAGSSDIRPPVAVVTLMFLPGTELDRPLLLAATGPPSNPWPHFYVALCRGARLGVCNTQVRDNSQ